MVLVQFGFETGCNPVRLAPDITEDSFVGVVVAPMGISADEARAGVAEQSADNFLVELNPSVAFGKTEPQHFGVKTHSIIPATEFASDRVGVKPPA